MRIKTSKKIYLNKITVANLTGNQMKRINAGLASISEAQQETDDETCQMTTVYTNHLTTRAGCPGLAETSVVSA